MSPRARHGRSVYLDAGSPMPPSASLKNLQFCTAPKALTPCTCSASTLHSTCYFCPLLVREEHAATPHTAPQRLEVGPIKTRPPTDIRYQSSCLPSIWRIDDFFCETQKTHQWRKHCACAGHWGCGPYIQEKEIWLQQKKTQRERLRRF